MKELYNSRDGKTRRKERLEAGQKCDEEEWQIEQKIWTLTIEFKEEKRKIK